MTATVKRRDRRGAARPAGAGRRDGFITLGTLTLAVPGRHNLLNALAAVAVGMELGLSFDRIAGGLKDFRGAERRFDVRGEPGGILIVDDYGHHPDRDRRGARRRARVSAAASSSRFSRTATRGPLR